MLKLNVHMKLMIYKIYTEEDKHRRIIDATEYQMQYIKENKDKISKAQFNKKAIKLSKKPK